MNDAEFKPIPGYEGLYECNQQGVVRSLDRVITHKNGRQQPIRGRLMTVYPDTAGYLHVSLCRDGRQKSISVHRIVALTFIPNPENKPAVNHIDGDKSNNNVNNLEWVTNAENNEHAWRNSLNCNHPRTVIVTEKCSGRVQVFSSILAATEAIGFDVHGYLERHTSSDKYTFKYAEAEVAQKIEDIVATKQHIGGNTPMPVRCITTDESFPSVRKCGQYFNIDDESIRRALRYSNGYIRKYNLKFEFIQDQEVN